MAMKTFQQWWISVSPTEKTWLLKLTPQARYNAYRNGYVIPYQHGMYGGPHPGGYGLPAIAPPDYRMPQVDPMFGQSIYDYPNNPPAYDTVQGAGTGTDVTTTPSAPAPATSNIVPSFLSSVPPIVWIGGVGLAVYLLFFRKKSAGASA